MAAGVAAGSIDRLEMDHLLAQWKSCDEQMGPVEDEIAVRQERDAVAKLLATIPGGSAYSSLALSSRMDCIERFPRRGSLPNYWGLTPTCRNSGEATHRLGSISKEGSTIAAFHPWAVGHAPDAEGPRREELVSTD